MLIIIDKRTPGPAIEELGQYGDVHLFESSGIVYDAISCHPDIFMFQDDNDLVIAPNTPAPTIGKLNEHSVSFVYGSTVVGEGLKSHTAYNCLATSRYLFHKKNYTDPVILDICQDRRFIPLPQAYSRCSMIALGDSIVTSDMGISMALNETPVINHRVSPEGIQLPPYPHGFIGGTCGVNNGRLFVIGSLRHLERDEELLWFIDQTGFDVIELYDGPMYDGGGIFFIDS